MDSQGFHFLERFVSISPLKQVSAVYVLVNIYLLCFRYQVPCLTFSCLLIILISIITLGGLAHFIHEEIEAP